MSHSPFNSCTFYNIKCKNILHTLLVQIHSSHCSGQVPCSGSLIAALAIACILLFIRRGWVRYGISLVEEVVHGEAKPRRVRVPRL